MPSWKKQGCIFKLDDAPNRSNHTQVPTPYVMEDRIRLYYAGRSKGQGFPAFIDIDRKDFSKIIRHQEKPIMSLGKPGMFDSDGIMPSCVIENNGEICMYYIGWNARDFGARYHNEIGIAVSQDGGKTFKRKFQGPIIGRTPTEPGLAVMPFVMQDNWFRMWYQSGTSWDIIDGQYEPVYVLKYAESLNGVDWDRKPEQCIKSNYPLEAFSRPCVILSGNTWHMWYCYRGSKDYRGGVGSYRIGYGQSQDGINFKRMDSLSGIDVSSEGWDSEMICYPYVIKIDGRLVMFYNGNGFGQSGIGWAEYAD